MSSEVRLLTAEEIREFAQISVNAYPGVSENTPEFKERMIENMIRIQDNVDSIKLFGLFRDGKLLGGMRAYYYQMNLFSRMIEVGGVGSVAVDLMHKKEKVAKELISFFIQHFQERGASFVMLYPFRPDFYKQMGFGYGPKMNQYKIKPDSFPGGSSKEGLVVLDETHTEQIRECYSTYTAGQHGMVLKTEHELKMLFKNPANRLIGYMKGETLEGYLLFSFEKGANFLMNDMVIKEWVYQTPEALLKLSNFIHTQADQINRVIWNTQDSSLEYLVGDATNGSNQMIPSVYHETNTAGTGLMYRIIDIEKFLCQMSIDQYIDCSFHLRVTDTFQWQESKVYHVTVVDGEMRASEKTGEADFEIALDISDCSSLFMGSVSVMDLYRYGKLKISSPEHLKTLHKVFANLAKPICITAF
jgi:predicted acetyltransferase